VSRGEREGEISRKRADEKETEEEGARSSCTLGSGVYPEIIDTLVVGIMEIKRDGSPLQTHRRAPISTTARKRRSSGRLGYKPFHNHSKSATTAFRKPNV